MKKTVPTAPLDQQLCHLARRFPPRLPRPRGRFTRTFRTFRRHRSRSSRPRLPDPLGHFTRVTLCGRPSGRPASRPTGR